MKGLLSIFYVICICIQNLVVISLLKALYYKKRNIHKYHQSLSLLGTRLCNTLLKLGPAFIKLGQLLSTRDDLLHFLICNELKKLQDDVPRVDFKILDKLLMLELQEQYFLLKIDKIPVAAASIAQVYKGYILNDDITQIEVAIKILRPNIRNAFAKNIKLIYFISDFLNKFISSTRRLRLLEVVQTIDEISKSELDMRLEAAATDKFRMNCNKQSKIYIPKIYWHFTTKSVLVSEWIDGQRIDTCNTSLKETLAQELAFFVLQQVYVDGFFHADIHPGNILIDKNNRLVLLDCGMHSYLPLNDRFFLAEIIYAFIQKDYDKVSELHFKAGYIITNTQNIEQLKNRFALACRTIATPLLNQPKIAMSKFLRRLFEITSEFGMKTQPQLILLQKNMISLESVLMMLNAHTDILSLIEPWFNNCAKQQLRLKHEYYKIQLILHKIFILLNKL